MDHIPTVGQRAACAMLLALVVGAACGTARTPSRVDTPPSTGMSGYRTYTWWKAPLNQTTQGYSDTEERLDEAVRLVVEQGLSGHGYRGNAHGRPDFVMRYGAAVYEKATPTFRNYLSRADGGGKDMGVAPGAPAGTLTLEAIDVKSGRVAWQATTPAVFQHGPEQNPVTPAVRQMMESFPQSESN